jgi:hypothetical protein
MLQVCDGLRAVIPKRFGASLVFSFNFVSFVADVSGSFDPRRFTKEI